MHMDFPDEILVSIFRWLTCREVAWRVARTCQRWRAVALDPMVCRLCVLGFPYDGDAWPPVNKRDLCCRAAAAGHIDCVRDLTKSDTQYDCVLVSTAARHNRVALVRWLVDNKYAVNIDACRRAARHGHVECLAILDDAGCLWGEETLWAAARGGHIECVDYAIAHGRNQESHGFKLCRGPSTPAHVACVKKILAAGGRADDYSEELAVRAGHHDCMRLFGTGRSKWDDEMCAFAARHGDLDMLCYLHENGWPWEGYTLRAAAASENRDCLAYVLDNACPWAPDDLCRTVRSVLWTRIVTAVRPESGDTRPTTAAASMGRLDLLSDLCEKGYACGPETCTAAARRGYVDCLHYLYKRHCAWDHETPRAALTGKSRCCFEYAVSRGCPLMPVDRETADAHGWKTKVRLSLARPH